MIEEGIAVIHSMGVTLVKILPVSIALAAAFTVLTFFWACNPGRPWWRKRELLTDICYWFVIHCSRAICALDFWCWGLRSSLASAARRDSSNSTTTVMGRLRNYRSGCKPAFFSSPPIS
jgi:hypothetical protein